jgi:hypothetical protein
MGATVKIPADTVVVPRFKLAECQMLYADVALVRAVLRQHARSKAVSYEDGKQDIRCGLIMFNADALSNTSEGIIEKHLSPARATEPDTVRVCTNDSNAPPQNIM